jgi:hypothetical protein
MADDRADGGAAADYGKQLQPRKSLGFVVETDRFGGPFVLRGAEFDADGAMVAGEDVELAIQFEHEDRLLDRASEARREQVAEQLGTARGRNSGSNHKHHRLPSTIFVEQCSLSDAVPDAHAANR